jgi:hypothetical protein
MMLAVAVTALLMPFPAEAATGLAAVIAAIWVPALLVEMLIYDLAGRWPALLVALAICAGIAPLLLMPHLLDRDAFEMTLLGLTPLNLFGPFYAAWRLRSGMRLVAGEVLWAWFGMVWSTLFLAGLPHSAAERIGLMAEFSRLSIVLALLLARYGPRPAPPRSPWGHRIGWALMEADVLVWGWYAWGFLRHWRKGPRSGCFLEDPGRRA